MKVLKKGPNEMQSDIDTDECKVSNRNKKSETKNDGSANMFSEILSTQRSVKAYNELMKNITKISQNTRTNIKTRQESAVSKKRKKNNETADGVINGAAGGAVIDADKSKSTGNKQKTATKTTTRLMHPE